MLLPPIDTAAFCGGLPTGLGGSIEIKDLENATEQNNNIYFNAAKRELEEETGGAYSISEGTQLFLKTQKAGQQDLTFLTVDVQALNESTSMEKYSEMKEIVILDIDDFIHDQDIKLFSSEKYIKKSLIKYLHSKNIIDEIPKTDKGWESNGGKDQKQWRDYYKNSTYITELIHYIKNYMHIKTKEGRNGKFIGNVIPVQEGRNR